MGKLYGLSPLEYVMGNLAKHEVCVAVCCSALQCVAVRYCSALQRLAVRCCVLQFVAVCCATESNRKHVLQCDAV